MNKLAILGAGGMLGRDLQAVLAKQNRPHAPFDLPELDIRDQDAVAKATKDARIIVNCAAYTNVDGAETAAELAHEVNAVAVGNLGRLATERGQYVLHISTDFVYDGRKESPYTEADPPHPLNVYGETKWRGEQLLGASGCRHAILRIEWTYGRHGRHFVSKIQELAARLDLLKVVGDQIGAPTPTTAVASAILALVDKETEGTYLYAAQGYASRFEVAQLIATHRGYSVRLEPCSSDAFPAPAHRPLNSRFDCSRFDSLATPSRPHWHDALIHYLETTI